MTALRQLVSLLCLFCFLVLLFTMVLPEANWWYARTQVDRALRAQPTLQRDLLTLGALAGEWEQVVGAATYLRPLTAATGAIKSVNAWNGLLTVLDAGHSGAGLALRLLDGLAGELVSQQARLEQLAGLDGAVRATGEFLESPNRTTLLALHQAYAPRIVPIREFHTQVADWSPTLATIDHNLGGLNQALATLEHDPNPFNQAAAALLTPVIAPLTVYVAGLSSTISAQTELLPADLATMHTVVDFAGQAAEWDSRLTAPPFDLLGEWVHANAFLFLGAFALFLGLDITLRFVH